MNMLQGLTSPQPFCVSLNRHEEVDAQHVVQSMTYHHPIYDLATLDAQQRRDEISGASTTRITAVPIGDTAFTKTEHVRVSK